MFRSRFWRSRYFSARYWTKAQTGPIPPPGPAYAEASTTIRVDTPRRRITVQEG